MSLFNYTQDTLFCVLQWDQRALIYTSNRTHTFKDPFISISNSAFYSYVLRATYTWMSVGVKVVSVCICVRDKRERVERGHPHPSPLCAMCLTKPEVCRCCWGFFFLRKDTNAEIICRPSSKLFFTIREVSVLISIFHWLVLRLHQNAHIHTHTRTKHSCSTETSQTPASCCLPRSAHTSLMASAPPVLLISIWLTACGTQTHLMTNTHLYAHTHTHTNTQRYTHTHILLFVDFADIKTQKAAVSMQNNEVKAILISLGDKPNASRGRGMRNEDEKYKREAVPRAK